MLLCASMVIGAVRHWRLRVDQIWWFAEMNTGLLLLNSDFQDEVQGAWATQHLGK
jgi:hypothetical protein